MTIRSAGGERTVTADEFFVGVFETAVGEGDLLTRISVPAAGKGHRRRDVRRDARRARDVRRERRRVGGRRRLAGRARVRRRRSAARDGGRGCARAAGVDEAVGVRAAVEGLGATLDPPSDVHASADYRRSLAETSVVRAVLQAAERAAG